jgi:hypothetical protein
VGNPYIVSDVDTVTIELLEGPRPPAWFVSDGCTMAPDEILGHDLRPACLYHDWLYFLGGTEAARGVADRRFFRNLLACGASPMLAGVYYRRVRTEGLAFWVHIPPVGRASRAWYFLRALVSRYFRVKQD